MRRPAGADLASHNRQAFCLADLEMKNIHHQKSSAIEQNDMSDDHYVLTAGRRWREPAFEIAGAAHNLCSQSCRQGSADDQLAFQSCGETVALGESGRQMIMVLVVPAAHLVAVMIRIVMVRMVVVVAVPIVAPVVITILVAIMLLVAVPVLLGDSDCRSDRE